MGRRFTPSSRTKIGCAASIRSSTPAATASASGAVIVTAMGATGAPASVAARPAGAPNDTLSKGRDEGVVPSVSAATDVVKSTVSIKAMDSRTMEIRTTGHLAGGCCCPE